MSDQAEIVAKGLERARAEARWEDKQFAKSLRTPKWNERLGRWVKPLEALGGFSKESAGPKKPKPPPLAPHPFEESIAEADEDGKIRVRPLPDCEEITPAQLYDFTEAERFQYAKAARDAFHEISERETGVCGDPEKLAAQWSEAEELKSQGHLICARIERASRREADFHQDESLFVPMYRETNYGIYSYYLFSKCRTQAPKFRNTCFNPYMASMTRSKMLKALESYLERHLYARMFTFTSGKRVGLSGIRERIQWLHRQISKLNHWLKTLGIEIVFRSTELGTPETKGKKKANGDPDNSDGYFERSEDGEVLFHVHAHCLVRTLSGRDLTPKRWSKIRKKVWRRWGFHWDDSESVRDVRELCKYVSKPGALLELEDWELLKLYRETNSLRFVQPLGELKDEIRNRKENKLRLEKVRTPEGTVFQEVHDWNCHREDKDEFATNFERDEKKLDKLQAMIDGTETSPEPEIRILAKCVPGFAPGSLVKEPRIVVMATNWNQAAIERHPLVQDLIRRTWEQWSAGQTMAAAMRVHTGAITVHEPPDDPGPIPDRSPGFEPSPFVDAFDFWAETSPEVLR